MRTIACAVFAVLMISGASLAQEVWPDQSVPPGPPPRSGFDATYRRHFGFYIRPDLGFGYMATSQSSQTFSGFAGLGGVAIGGAVRENDILAFHIFDSVVQNPTTSYGSTLQDSTMALVGFGPQYTHYFMPSNVYLSLTAGPTRIALDTPFGRGSTKFGLGTRIALGKEWWAGDHWGLGLVGHFSYSFNDDDSNYTLTSYAVGLAFSATYN
jgi:hypothetical protein